MNITYFYRSNNAGFSIAKAFKPLSDEMNKNHVVKDFFVPARRADPLSILRNLFYVFRHRDKKGINHITGDIHYCVIALIGCKSVLTVHDTSMVDCVENPIKKRLIKWFWFNIPVRLATRVICISEHTYQVLQSIERSDKTSVIFNSCDPAFVYNIRVFNDSRPVILQIGTSWNKNLLNVILALSDIPCHLRIIGVIQSDALNLLNDMNLNYSNVIGISDEDIISEYTNCDIVSFCSTYEGFGMPIIEGNASGRCVVTSSISPMTEVAGDAAIFVDPNNVKSMADAFEMVIRNYSLRDDLISKGFENIKRFDLHSNIEKHLNIYKTCLNIS
jgi:glycosyltransferase involved in cell wall biosynthesis